MLKAQTLLSYYQSAAMGAYIETYQDSCKVTLNEYGQGLDLTHLTSLILSDQKEEASATQALTE